MKLKETGIKNIGGEKNSFLHRPLNSLKVIGKTFFSKQKPSRIYKIIYILRVSHED